MNYKLWENGTPGYCPEYGQPEPNLKPFLLDMKPGDKPRGCVIVCPGGGYEMLAPHEADPIAEMINGHGLHSFVLTYRLKPYHFPEITSDALRAIRFVRYNAEKFGIDPNHIAILGFSAGGHLAMSASRLFDYGKGGSDEIDAVSSRPDGAILCYAVTTLHKPYTHMGTRNALIGGLEDEAALENELSAETNVRPDTPPTFMWHTAEDGAVPVQQALASALALREKKIPFELHIFPYGYHGLGLAENYEDVKRWPELLGTWLRKNGYMPNESEK